MPAASVPRDQPRAPPLPPRLCLYLFPGGWGIVFYTLNDRFNSVILGCSKALGNPITLYDLPRLLWGRDIPPPAPRRSAAAAFTARAATPRASAGGEGAPVEVELVFRGQRVGAPAKAAGAEARRARDGSPAAAVAAALAAALKAAAARPGRKWKPACVAALEEEEEEEESDAGAAVSAPGGGVGAAAPARAGRHGSLRVRHASAVSSRTGAA